MKILQVITSLRTGGAEKLIVDTFPHYRKRGLDVDILLFDGTDTPFKRQLEAMGARIYSLGTGGSVYNPIRLFRLLPYLRRYDIVHTHNTAPQLFAAIGSVLCSVVLCTTEHTTSNRRRGWTWYGPVDRWMYSRYRRVISISEGTTRELLQSTEVRCPVVTIPNGIDVRRYAEAQPADRRTLGCTANDFLLVMVAGFRYQKDQDTVIRSLRFLPTDVHLCLVGGGERQKACEQLAAELHFENRVTFAGIRTDVPAVLKAADGVVMSSHYEGFGLAAVEGMAAGRPVIASDVEGLGDIVRNYGMLFPVGDERALADAVLKLKSDEAFRKEVSARCRERAWQYDISRMVEGYIKVYEELMAVQK